MKKIILILLAMFAFSSFNVIAAVNEGTDSGVESGNGTGTGNSSGTDKGSEINNGSGTGNESGAGNGTYNKHKN